MEPEGQRRDESLRGSSLEAVRLIKDRGVSYASITILGVHTPQNGRVPFELCSGVSFILRLQASCAERVIWNIGQSGSLRPDVRLADDSAVVIVLHAQEHAEIGAAHCGRV